MSICVPCGFRRFSSRCNPLLRQDYGLRRLRLGLPGWQEPEGRFPRGWLALDLPGGGGDWFWKSGIKRHRDRGPCVGFRGSMENSAPQPGANFHCRVSCCASFSVCSPFCGGFKRAQGPSILEVPGSLTSKAAGFRMVQ